MVAGAEDLGWHCWLMMAGGSRANAARHHWAIRVWRPQPSSPNYWAALEAKASSRAGGGPALRRTRTRAPASNHKAARATRVHAFVSCRRMPAVMRACACATGRPAALVGRGDNCGWLPRMVERRHRSSSARNCASPSSRGGGWPKNSANAAAAWPISMANPSTVANPAARAACRNGVSAGKVTIS